MQTEIERFINPQPGSIDTMKLKPSILAAATLLALSAYSQAAPGPIDMSSGSGTFANTVAGSASFTDLYSFTLGTPVTDLVASIITFAVGSRDIDFTTITLAGPSLAATTFSSVSADPLEVWSLSLPGPLLAGSYTLSVTGKNFGTLSASYSGTFEVTPVPEPGTMAMVLAGLGVLGWVSRRRLGRRD